MKILEYELIKIVKNTHPNKLEFVLSHYRSNYKGAEDKLLEAVELALETKYLPSDMYNKIMRHFRWSAFDF